MIKAVLAVRYCSAATGQRRAVLLALATYSNEDGDDAFPKWETLEHDSGASRPTVHRAISDALKREEIVCTGERKSKTKVYSFAPIVHSLTLRRSHPETPIVSENGGIVSPRDPHSLTLRPDQAVIKQLSSRDRKEVSPSQDLDPSKNNGSPTRFETEQELLSLIAKNEAVPTEGTERAIQELRVKLNGKV